jgi:hypothetical protein
MSSRADYNKFFKTTYASLKAKNFTPADIRREISQRWQGKKERERNEEMSDEEMEGNEEMSDEEMEENEEMSDEEMEENEEMRDEEMEMQLVLAESKTMFLRVQGARALRPLVEGALAVMKSFTLSVLKVWIQASKNEKLQFGSFKKKGKKVRKNEALKRMEAWAAVEDKAVVHVEGEGNCMYRALSFHLFGTESRYPEVRAETVARARLGKCMNEEWTEALLWEEIDECARNGEWGGQEMLKSAAEMYGVHIVLFDVRASLDGERYEFGMKPTRAFREDTIHIMHYLDHFWVAMKTEAVVQALEVVKEWLDAQGFGDFPFLFTDEEERSDALWSMPSDDLANVLATVNISGVCR